MKILILVSVLLINDVAFSQETESLKLTIHTDKEVYLVGDDVKVIYTVENVGQDAISFFTDEPNFQFQATDGKDYEELKYEYSTFVYGPAFITLQPKDSLVEEVTIAHIREGEVYNVPGGKRMPVAEDLYFTGLYIDIPAQYKRLLAKNGLGQFKISFEYCDGSAYYDNCSGCPNFFMKEDCAVMDNTQLLRERLKERNRQYGKKKRIDSRRNCLLTNMK